MRYGFEAMFENPEEVAIANTHGTKIEMTAGEAEHLMDRIQGSPEMTMLHETINQQTDVLANDGAAVTYILLKIIAPTEAYSHASA